jgi:hypothetical protein
MAVMHRGSRERNARLYAKESADRRAQENADQERWPRRVEALRTQVRADIEAAEAARAAELAELARMTPAQLAAREHRAQTQIPPPGPGKPDGYYLALEAIRREDAANEREQQEREQDLPARRDEWDGKVQEIDAALEDALGEARRRCAEVIQAARERADHERAELGERPKLEQAEAVAV